MVDYFRVTEMATDDSRAVVLREGIRAGQVSPQVEVEQAEELGPVRGTGASAIAYAAGVMRRRCWCAAGHRSEHLTTALEARA